VKGWRLWGLFTYCREGLFWA